MGRIKTTFVKRQTKTLLKTRGEVFTTDFEQNKKLVDDHTEIESKKLRNIIAGYMTRLKRKE